jgi:hypothetical protein
MTIIQFILAFISAFGLGAIVQTYISQRADTKKRNFQEKKESYFGFLEAMHRSEIERSEEAALYVGHWQARIELVGSTDVIKACSKITETNPTPTGVHPERPQAIKQLRDAIRKDLGVASN